MRTIAIVVALFGVIVFSKLYLAEPSASDGEKVVAKLVQDNSQGNMKLTGFRQTGGKEYILSGVRVIPDDVRGVGRMRQFSGPGDECRVCIRPPGRNKCVSHACGDHRTVKGAVQFEKTSYAWVGQPM